MVTPLQQGRQAGLVESHVLNTVLYLILPARTPISLMKRPRFRRLSQAWLALGLGSWTLQAPPRQPPRLISFVGGRAGSSRPCPPATGQFPE